MANQLPLRVRRASFVHRPQVVLRMLKVIFSRNTVAVQGFGASQLQIALIIPLRVLGLLQEVDSGTGVFP